MKNLTAQQYKSLTDEIYSSIMAQPDNELGEMGDIQDEAERIVNDWCEKEGITIDEPVIIYPAYIGKYANFKGGHSVDLDAEVERLEKLINDSPMELTDSIISEIHYLQGGLEKRTILTNI